MWNGCQAHAYNPSDPEQYQQWFFLPWHRLMLKQFEGVIREVLHDEDFHASVLEPGHRKSRRSHRPCRVPGAGQHVVQRHALVLGQRRRTDRHTSTGTGSLWTPSTRSSTSTRQPAALGSIPGSIRTRTSSLISPSGATWPNSPRSAATRCSISITPTSTGIWESWNRLGNTNPTDPKYLNRKFAYGDRSGKRVDLPVSAADRTAQLGYEYDSYEKPPQPRNLTTEEAAERERDVQGVSTSGPSAVPMVRSMRPALLEENSNDPEALDQPDLRWHRRTETHRQGGPEIGSAGATRGSSCMRPASPSLSRWPSSGGRDSNSLVPQALRLVLLGALATLGRHREGLSHIAFTA